MTLWWRDEPMDEQHTYWPSIDLVAIIISLTIILTIRTVTVD
jgi:hypothetical protein